ncbi:MAG: LysM peptidoglycan-binding domain-containing protein [Sulfuricella sp.]|nr:LysM peptidoglycan-binding domain-containing protein [Sulfuricella sp.]
MKTPILALILLFGFSSLSYAAEIALRDNPPDHYVVAKGDTLWGVSGKFLKEPWRWPEIWKMNRQQIKNPHWIYPGDMIVLDTRNGSPELRLVKGQETVRLSPRVRAEQTEAAAIPSIPQTEIGPFLSKPLVIEEGALETAPYIIDTDESRVVLGAGNTAYVQTIPEGGPLHWQIYRPGKALADPDSGAVLGYEAVYLGDAKVTRYGGPATIEITKSVQEINIGDRLVEAKEEAVNAYVPHAPEQIVSGRVISAYGGVAEVGSGAIVTLNRGGRNGLEIGHVLAIYRHGRSVKPNESDKASPEIVKLPDERYGLVFVFRVFDKLSYALVMQTTRPVQLLDDVRTP